MPVRKAKSHYISGKYNCAQSVIAAFKDKFGFNDAAVDKYLGYGSGNAPEGLCGAYCAARDILAEHKPEKLKAFEDYFKDLAGSLKCKEIRGLKKLPCLGCVERSAQFLADHS